jgi:CTP-dependent riboflavin kinase
MKELTPEEKERLLDELVSSVKAISNRQSYEITIQEFATKAGISYDSAKRILSRELREGRMTKRRIILDGKLVTVYSIV